MSNSNLSNFKALLENRKTYHSLEIYPPECFDEQLIFQKLPSKDGFMVPDDYDYKFDESEEDCSSDSESDLSNFQHSSRKKKKILQYLKEHEFMFNQYVTWESMEIDMYRLSEKFKNWIFVVYGKTELFVDNMWIKIYKNGPLIHASNNVEVEIKLRLPNGIYKSVDQNGFPLLDPEYDVSTQQDQRERGLVGVGAMHLATDVGVLFGKTIADFGSLATEGAVAFKVLSIGVQFIDEMHQNMIRYGNNKGRCKKLYDRCANVLGLLQNMEKNTLHLGYVISVVQQIEESKKILEDYGKQWKVTKFFASKSNKRKFVDINNDLSDSVLDFGVNCQIQRRLFIYKELKMK